VSGTDEGPRPDTRRTGPERSQPAPPRPRPWKHASAWNIPDVDPDETADPGRPLAALVSFHYLRRAVRRRWLRCALPGLLGLLLAAGFLALSPALPTATTTLLLNHDERVDPASAIATDISLLSTHEVAAQTVRALGLSMDPDELRSSVTPVPTASAQVLQLTMTGPTQAEAMRRLSAFSKVYLDFRAQQVTKQSAVLVNTYDQRIAQLQSKVARLTAEIKTLGTNGASASDTVADDITQRSAANSQLADLEQLKQQAQLQESSVVRASGVIDSPTPLSGGQLRHLVLVLASGLIVGLALGFVFVVVQAILSDRLWLRVEVASALEAPVPLSVGRLAPLPWYRRALTFLPRIKRQGARRAADRELVAQVIERVAAAAERRPSVAMVCLGNSDDMRFGMIAAGAALQRSGRSALLVDLTASGRVGEALSGLRRMPPEDRPDVFRPTVVPSLSRGPADLDAADWDDVALAKARNAVPLVITDLDPAIGLDYLTAWTDDVIIAITAGRSGVELVRTAGELVRAAGLRLQAALVLRGPGDDVSFGETARDDGAQAEASTDAAARPGTTSGERSLRW
jgi:capsular polysaccharide biosynthesis protein